MPKGLLNPKNAVTSTGGGFREGFVRVDESSFIVHKPQESTTGRGTAPIATALCWDITRLDENLEPLTHAEDETPLTEKLVFGLGGKSLIFAHPGQAESPDTPDDDIDDKGTEPGATGNTIKLTTNPDWRPNEKASVSVLLKSLQAAGYKEEYLDRVWAPDFKGLVCHMGTKVSDEKINDQSINYKVVTKIVKAPYEKKAAKGSSTQTGATSSGKPNGAADKQAEAEGLIAGILTQLESELDGQQMTRKALNTRINQKLQEGKVDTRLFVPVLTLAKDDKWLTKHAAEYSMTVDFAEGTVQFGS